MKKVFDFKDDEEFFKHYKSHISVQGSEKKKQMILFESMVLFRVIKKLGMSKNFFLEDLLQQRDSERVLVHYSKSHFINTEFF